MAISLIQLEVLSEAVHNVCRYRITKLDNAPTLATRVVVLEPHKRVTKVQTMGARDATD